MEVQEIKEQLKEIFRTVINNDKWITIHPHGEDSDDYRRIKLEDGETPKEAIERTYGKKDKILKDYKENTSHYGKKEHQEEIISLYEGLKNPNKSEARKKEDRELLEHHLKELNKYSDTSDIHLSDEETKRENKIKEIKKELNKKQPDTKEESKKSKIDFSEYSDAELEHAIDVYKSNLSTAMEYGDDQYNTEKDMLSEIEKELGRRKAQSDTKDGSKDISKEEYAKIKEQVSKMSDDELVKAHFESQKGYESETPRAGSMTKHEATYGEVAQELKRRTGRGFSAASTESEIKEALLKAKSDSKGENEKYRSRFPDIQNLIGTLSKDDKYFDSKYRTAEKRLNEKLKFAKKELKERDFADMPSVKKSKEQIVKTIEEEIEKLKLMKDKNKQLRLFNNKEQDMALIEELKKLITKVENTKGEKDMEIENEKVDKRKLIDEVAGIMKSAGCDDEDIRTAIGKMEKIGYDDSEKSADNCGGKKVKNEEKEPEKDEKEVEEVKEEIKEDVGNKCDNSKSSFDKINGIYNSIKQVAQGRQFVSRQDKLNNAVEYFK